MSEYFNSKIISKKKENDLVSSFAIKPVPDGFTSRKAGQYLLLKIFQEDAWSEAHPFTITSRPGDDYLKITVKKIGGFTKALHSINPPVNVQVSGPHGIYGKTIDQWRKIVFIAGGIGITPFISLLMHLDERRSTAQIRLFWAVNKWEEYFSLAILKEYSSRLNLKIVLVALEFPDDKSEYGPNLVWKRGYLTTEILEEMSELNDAALYMCGSENMQKYVFSQIKELGLLPENVETEKIGIYMKDK